MPESVTVRTRTVGTVAVVEIEGYLNNTGGEKTAKACEALVAEGSRRLVLNFEQCRMANSVGISYLIDVLEQMRELEGQVAFCCLTPTLAKTFTIMGLLNEAHPYATEREAVQALDL